MSLWKMQQQAIEQKLFRVFRTFPNIFYFYLDPWKSLVVYRAEKSLKYNYSLYSYQWDDTDTWILSLQMEAALVFIWLTVKALSPEGESLLNSSWSSHICPSDCCHHPLRLPRPPLLPPGASRARRGGGAAQWTGSIWRPRPLPPPSVPPLGSTTSCLRCCVQRKGKQEGRVKSTSGRKKRQLLIAGASIGSCTSIDCICQAHVTLCNTCHQHGLTSINSSMKDLKRGREICLYLHFHFTECVHMFITAKLFCK